RIEVEDSATGAGELVYSGPNVMMGYALSAGDLIHPAGPDELHTGDIAVRDECGLYRIVGRKSRFIKPFGIRIGLDEVERWVAARGHVCAAVGDDSRLLVYTADANADDLLAEALASWLKLPAGTVELCRVDSIPRLESGKIDYRSLNRDAVDRHAVPAGEASAARADIAVIFARYFPGADIPDNASFAEMGGDSLKFIQFSMELEAALGHLPDGWEGMNIAQLRGMALSKQDRAHTAGWMAWRTLDVAILLRFYAIVCIVTHHLRLWPASPEGSSLLLALAGMSFGRFQLEDVARTGSLRSIWSSTAAIAIPTIGYVALLQLAHREFFLWSLLLVGNFHSISAYTDQWFLDMYVQIYLLMALLLSSGWVKGRIGTQRLPLAIGLFLLAVLARSVVPQLWDTTALDNRVPHYWFWLFAWGIMMVQLRSRGAKALSLALFVLTAFLFYRDKSMTTVVNLAVCATIMTILPAIRVPAFFRTVIMEVAAATLFIYLTHFQLARIIGYIVGEDQLWAQVFGALAGGVLIGRLYMMAARAVLQKLRGRERGGVLEFGMG
ncbi:MAG: AMP-binding protein, partial [Sphingobium sp.]